VRSDSVFSASSLQAFLSLILLCGIALILSIQSPSRIASLHVSNLPHWSGLFHVGSVFLFGLFAVNRGSVIAASTASQMRQLKLALRLLAHITYGLLLLLPYFVFSRALLADRLAGIVSLVAYMAVSGLFLGLASHRLELRGSRKNRGAFLLRYGFYFASCLVPLGIGISHRSLSFVLSASPIGFATQIIEGASAIELLVGFLVPSIGILWLLTRRPQFARRHHAI